jgi:sodium transport system permease protein
MIFTIFLKELKDTLRDRRTVMMMIVIPTMIFPLVMNIFMKVSTSFEKDAAEKKLTIGVVSPKISDLDRELLQLPKQLGAKQFVHYRDTNELKSAIKSDVIQIGLFIPDSANEQKALLHPIQLTVFHDGTDLGMKERADNYLNFIQTKWKLERYQLLQIDESKITPMVTAYSNVASDKEMIGKLVGGFLPYIFIAFGFMGCMYPAIDLFTGEKERGTIETLLTTPVPRWQILFGKMGVVVLSGILAATFSLLGLFVSVEFLQSGGNTEILKIVSEILSISFIGMLYLLLFPLIVFFAGVMIPIAVRAKSFKEAQSIISPLNIVIVLPAMVGFFPGIELNSITALIPVVNIVLATKELIAGTLQWELVLIAFGVMVALATSAVFLSYHKFESEKNIIN